MALPDVVPLDIDNRRITSAPTGKTVVCNLSSCRCSSFRVCVESTERAQDLIDDIACIVSDTTSSIRYVSVLPTAVL